MAPLCEPDPVLKHRSRLQVPIVLFAASMLAACGDSSADDLGAGGSSGATGTTGSGSGEPAGLSGITAAHNAVRQNVSPPAATPIPDLTWSDDLAAVAQAWAEECVFEHSMGTYGENLYASTGGQATPEAVVQSWADEVAYYNYETNACVGVCGHYTQVVWAESLRIGCGKAECTTGSPFGSGAWSNWVCNYDPPGNFVGEKPY